VRRRPGAASTSDAARTSQAFGDMRLLAGRALAAQGNRMGADR
jgi:hypothetical protein